MAGSATLNSVSEALPTITHPLHYDLRRSQRRRANLGYSGTPKSDTEDGSRRSQISRRLALGLASVSVIGNIGIGHSLAEDNGLWLNGPLPVPSVNNEIANKETGTRSFLKKGVYMANIGTKGSAYRIRKNAFDLIALGDLINQDAWDYVRQYLRFKSTFMYYDFDKVISATPIDDKQAITNLATRLFDNVEKLLDAVNKRDLPLTESCYQDTTSILQEVMNRMA